MTPKRLSVNDVQGSGNTIKCTCISTSLTISFLTEHKETVLLMHILMYQLNKIYKSLISFHNPVNLKSFQTSKPLPHHTCQSIRMRTNCQVPKLPRAFFIILYVQFLTFQCQGVTEFLLSTAATTPSQQSPLVVRSTI